ncbi:hypothetical protein [Pseudodesulfovibrio pelocollis]|uniref:hypothetical protein n=1 Tax=Pseudodesulfovibrio pelocollis TaxID=3051432 RepID=UPI00255B22A5|nr:hypothetical protein [Pseudodesulfovibrio sp. SB368]
MDNRLLSKLFLGGGTALNLFGGVSDAEEAWSTGLYNRSAALRDARSVGESGQMDAQQFERQARDFVGIQKARISGMGIAFDGSAMDIMADTMAQLELEKKNRATETAQRVQALRIEAEQSAKRGASGRRQGYLKASGSLLRGVSDIMGIA